MSHLLERPNGDPIGQGDIWFNSCTGETWIYYNQTVALTSCWWYVGPQGPKGDNW